MTSRNFRMDTLLAGTLIFPCGGHCAGMMSSAAQPVEIIPGMVKSVPGRRENRSPSFPESLSPSAGILVTLTSERFSRSPRNRVHLAPESTAGAQPER